MSLLPLTHQFAVATSFFLQPLQVTDTAYAAVDGVDIQQVQGVRTIDAAVDVGGGQRLENLFGGNVSDGDIGVTTPAELYIDDIHAPGSTPRRQSYLVYNGLSYRVKNLAPWQVATGQRVYLAERHVKQDLV